MSTKITPKTKGTTVREKTPGPHGITLEMRKIGRALPVAVHEHTVSEYAGKRFKDFGHVPNRAARRALGRARGVFTPRPSLVPYEKA